MNPSAPDRRDIGQRGEDVAERYLRRKGFKLLHRNLRLGRTGELDLVMDDHGTLVFVEVKARIAGEGLGGLMNITDAKQRKLWQLGQLYLQRHGPLSKGTRFDAIEVEFASDSLRRAEVKHIPDAFRAS